MIPKVINYCWFGGNKKSKLIEKCIKSWKQYCPQYKIIEWNESNFDVNCCTYVKEAYENKKWAFVSDYARHKILNDNGGIYVDTDVEFIKPIDNLLNDNFVALEKDNIINTGLIMACDKNNDYCKFMLDSYHKDKFILDDGSQNLKSVCYRTTEYFVSKGFIKQDIIQKIDGFIIYPKEYFCPIDIDYGTQDITKNTYTLHHYDGSWLAENKKFKRKFIKFIGKKNTERLIKIKDFFTGKK